MQTRVSLIPNIRSPAVIICDCLQHTINAQSAARATPCIDASHIVFTSNKPRTEPISSYQMASFPHLERPAGD